jgi:hypothetical protein
VTALVSAASVVVASAAPIALASAVIDWNRADGAFSRHLSTTSSMSADIDDR